MSFIKWLVIFYKIQIELVVLSHQLIDDCRIIYDNFLGQKFKMYNTTH